MLALLKTFSTDYANAITAIAALGALALAVITLWFLKREFSAKYRPYVMPVADVSPAQQGLGCVVSIIPSNVGPHPCKCKLTNIKLHIGDETYETPDNKEWLLIPPHGVVIRMPAGHVNDMGVTKIREARYKVNRIELTFTLHTTSIENKFNESSSYSYEIDVSGEKPLAMFRPEWINKVS